MILLKNIQCLINLDSKTIRNVCSRLLEKLNCKFSRCAKDVYKVLFWQDDQCNTVCSKTSMNGQNILCQNGCSKQQLCVVKFVSYNYFIPNCVFMTRCYLPKIYQYIKFNPFTTYFLNYLTPVVLAGKF